MKKIDNKIVHLILLIGAFVSFATFAIMGIGSLVEWNVFSINLSLVSVVKFNLYSINLLGYIFVPITAIFFIGLITYSILYFVNVSKSVRSFKIVSLISYFLIFGLTITQLILLLDRSDLRSLTGLGVAANIFMILTIVFSMFAFFLNFFSLFTLSSSSNNTRTTTKEEIVIERRKISLKEIEEKIQILREIKKLFDENILTEKEYNDIRKKYIEYL